MIMKFSGSETKEISPHYPNSVYWLIFYTNIASEVEVCEDVFSVSVTGLIQRVVKTIVSCIVLSSLFFVVFGLT